MTCVAPPLKRCVVKCWASGISDFATVRLSVGLKFRFDRAGERGAPGVITLRMAPITHVWGSKVGATGLGWCKFKVGVEYTRPGDSCDS